MKQALAVVAGFVLWSVLWLCYNQLLLKAGVLPSDLTQPLTAPMPLLLLLGGSVVFSIVSGYIAARIAGVPAMMTALVLGILLLATGIFFQLKTWHSDPRLVQRDVSAAAHSDDVRGCAHALAGGERVMVQRFMEGTAIVLGVAALSLVFAPELALARLSIAPTPAASMLAQLYGAALFGLAMTSWLARTMLLGGIYGKAVVSGGFAHALAGAFALLHTLPAASGNVLVWGACTVYVLLAIGFATLMFGRGPAAPASATPS